MHYDWQGGQMMFPFGLEAALANRFRALGGDEDTKTSATSGQPGSASFKSADLQSCLESKLRQMMDLNGSLEYALTWKRLAMPLAPHVCQLAASARRTSVSGCSGLPLAEISGWKTPTSRDRPDSEMRKAKGSQPSRLGQEARMVIGWATPTTRDWKDGASTLDGVPINYLLARQVKTITGWATPQTIDTMGSYRLKRRKLQGGCGCLKGQVALLLQPHGVTEHGSHSQTEPSVRLNPAHSRWLMGFPAVWDQAAPNTSDYDYWQQKLTGRGESEVTETQ